MPISEIIAEQIASLLNTQNRLTVQYSAAKVLEHQDRYIVRLGESFSVLGAVEVKRVQWYQCEIDHLSVDPQFKRQGIGTWLLQKAETRAMELGAGIAQCTIRVGNQESEGLFTKHGYTATVTFLNQQSGNRVTVYQKILAPDQSTEDA
ncbi:MAG: GNAT family N-acetyltransferase [Planctomycetota bacterium]